MIQKTVISRAFSVGLLEPSPWLPASLTVRFKWRLSLLSCCLLPLLNRRVCPSGLQLPASLEGP